MTLTFTSDPASGRHDDEHQTVLRGHGELPDGLPLGGIGPVLGKTGRPTSVLGRLWRFASKLPAYLSERRRLPPEGDYLRRDIGLSEREAPQEYWQYYFLDR
ncbi:MULTISPECIES: hypothetical protein [unclassified Mesorhizobium]|uniref:hypothetical protein n=1 Tax=unclassified Mesorhizobium TaxID=325217 RepID=UPI0009DE7E60|nr:hypothetical protein [Mesorhizobium sp. L103C119B0]